MSTIRGQRRAPMKKRVTLSSIPPPSASVQTGVQIQAQSSWADSLGSMIIPPCVRIEGCTPPSDSSIDDPDNHDADLDQYGARTSIDSAAMADYRPSDIQLNFLNNATQASLASTAAASAVSAASVASISEVVIVPSNLQSGGSTTVHVGGATSSGAGSPQVTPPGGCPPPVSAGTAGGPVVHPGIHHPHHRHHRPYSGSALVRGPHATPTGSTPMASGSSTTISHSTMFTDIP